MINSTRQVYSLLLLLFIPFSALPQDKSIFFNYDGKGNDELTLARSHKLRKINIYYQQMNDSCLNEVAEFDGRGRLTKRSNYSCIEGVHYLVYQEKFKYDGKDSVIYAGFMSDYKDDIHQHYTTNRYRQKGDTLVKIAVTRDSVVLWDSVVTKYVSGQIVERSKRNPIIKTGSGKTRIYDHYTYENGRVTSIRSDREKDYSSRFLYNPEGKITSVQTLTGSGIVNEKRDFSYDSKGRLNSYSLTFPAPMRTEYEFDESNRLTTKRYYEEDDRNPGKMILISTTTYRYNSRGFIDKLWIKMERAGYTLVASVFYE